MSIPLTSNSSFKSYMDGAMITCKTSRAYQVIKELHVENGLYTDGKYIAIAISSYYGNVGDKFRITLSSGKTFLAIMSDTKASHELNEKYEHADGSLIEFIIDTDEARKYYPKAILTGNFNNTDEYKGEIVKIERLNNENN